MIKESVTEFVLLFHYGSSLEQFEFLCGKQPRAMQGLEQEREKGQRRIWGQLSWGECDGWLWGWAGGHGEETGGRLASSRPFLLSRKELMMTLGFKPL